jgi:phosphoribosylformylglycinamidine synthase subunit PurS
MRAKIYINYKDGILDPEGVTISKALNNIGIKGIENLSVGKCIEMDLHCNTHDEAVQIITESCDKLLANPNTEIYYYEIMEDK